MTAIENPTPAQANLVEAARLAIWRLFQEGYVDEDMATAGLLAVDLGTRRTRSLKKATQADQPHRASPRRRQFA